MDNLETLVSLRIIQLIKQQRITASKLLVVPREKVIAHRGNHFFGEHQTWCSFSNAFVEFYG